MLRRKDAKDAKTHDIKMTHPTYNIDMMYNILKAYDIRKTYGKGIKDIQT